MNCTKLEAAIRKKKIAGMIIRKKDYKGARDKLIEARNLYPALDNISEMITVCDILCTADFGLPGIGTDWYWVLQTNVAADESHIKSKYQKLTTLLEPIKSKFPGTESALTLIQDAFSVLSNREKRSMFDSKRAASWGLYESMNKETKATSQSSSGCKRAASETSDRGNAMNDSRELCTRSLRSCHGDGLFLENKGRNSTTSMGPEFLAGTHVIDEHNEKNCTLEVSCTPACMKTRGNGVEKPVGNMGLGSTCGCQPSSMNSMGCKRSDSDFYDFYNNRKAEVFAVSQIWAAYDQESMPRSYALIDSIGHAPFKMYVKWLRPSPVTVHERKWCEVGLPVACGYFDLHRSNVAVSGQTKFSHMVLRVKDRTDEKVEIYPQKGEVWAIYRDWRPFNWCSDPRTRKACGLQMVEILTGYSKQTGMTVECLEKVAGFRSIFQKCVNKGSGFTFQIPAGHLLRFSHNVPIFRFTGGEMDKISDGMFEMDPLAVPVDLVHDMTEPLEGRSSSDCSSFTNHPPLSPSMVSEPETESLKPKWSWKDISSDQMWAVYDGPDSMPRRYAKVNNVVSGSEVGVTFLEPHPMLDDEIHWVKENLPFVCGLFRAARTTINLPVSRFSHLVTCEYNAQKSLYRIYPKKGEIWAMYKKWNAKWKRSDYSSYQYQVVEILSDFSEDAEMKITSLIEVKGFMTFFQRQLHDGFELIRAVPRTEILSFSHQIPCFAVPGVENYGLPEGSLHVEPDALPLKLSN